MNALAQGAAGLALVLSLALLLTRRGGSASLIVACQTAVVAVAALAQADATVALLEAVEAVAVVWLSRRLPDWDTPLPPRTRPKTNAAGHFSVTRGSAALLGSLVAAALLAAISIVLPGAGLPLATVLAGILVLAAAREPARQALGVLALQNGIVLAVIAAGRFHSADWIAVAPLLPALAITGYWLGGQRGKLRRLMAPASWSWLDPIVCGLTLLLACLLPWQVGFTAGPLRLDAFATLVILLLLGLATAASCGNIGNRPIWGARFVLLGGTILAMLSAAPLLSWLGMALATVGAIAMALPRSAEAWQRILLACTGLGLALFGAIGAQTAPAQLAAGVCLLAGYGTLAVLAPELTIAAAALSFRMRATLPGELLIALGLVALLIAAPGLARRNQSRFAPWVDLGQAGVAVFACGLGTRAGDIAAVLQITLLSLTRSAQLLSHPTGPDRLAALAGMTGIPPFGLFPSLALILAASAAHSVWLLLPLLAGLAAIAWPQMLRLPSARSVSLPTMSPAWLPLALLALIGFAMPEHLWTWFRLAALSAR